MTKEEFNAKLKELGITQKNTLFYFNGIFLI
jgi:hypothetical protein